jgi:hypothetical protein
MDQLNSFADGRLIVGCVYCSSATDSREHVPSRVLLDEPYPEDLPIVDVCSGCNRSFSLDEEYVACLIECARTGSVEAVERPKIKRILSDSPALAERLRKARTQDGSGQSVFQIEDDRVRNVVLKLARGHAAFELDEQMFEVPSHFMAVPLLTLDEAAQRHFESPPTPTAWPEIGTRAFQRMVVAFDGPPTPLAPGWIEVQENRYRYVAIAEGPTMVRIVIGEYLACEVIWGLDSPDGG